MKKMPTFCAIKLARVANNLFDFFMPYSNFCKLFSNTNFANYLIAFSKIVKYLLLRSFLLNFLNFLDFRPQMSLFPVLGVVQRQIRWFRRHIFGI